MCAKFQAKSLSESKSPGGGQTDRQTDGISCAARIFLRASLRTAVTQIGSSKSYKLYTAFRAHSTGFGICIDIEDAGDTGNRLLADRTWFYRVKHA